jgi:transposase InsO family protein
MLYIALPSRFIYVAIILDAWSRLIVGYAIGRSIDARLTVAALKAAIIRREPGRAAYITPIAARKADSNGRRNTLRKLR